MNLLYVEIEIQKHICVYIYLIPKVTDFKEATYLKEKEKTTSKRFSFCLRQVLMDQAHIRLILIFVCNIYVQVLLYFSRENKYD